MQHQDHMSDQIDIFAWLGALRRRRLLVVGVAGVVMAAVVFWLIAATPKYLAEATIRVEPEANLLREESGFAGNTSVMSALVDGEVEVLKSETLLLALIKSQNLLNDAEFGIRPSRLDTVRAIFGIAPAPLPRGEAALDGVRRTVSEAINVRRLGLTHLVKIGVTSTDPEKSSRLANALADLYMTSQVETKIERTLISRDIISDRMEDSKALLSEAESRLDAFMAKLSDGDVDGVSRPDLLDMRDRIRSLETRSIEMQSRSEILEGALSTRSFEGEVAELVDEATRALLEQRAALAGEIASNPASDRVPDLQGQVALLDARIEQGVRAGVESTRGDIIAMNEEMDRRRGEIQAGILSSDLPGEVFSRIYALQQEIEVARSEYQSLLARMRQLDAMSSLQVANASIVSKSIPPGAASSPQMMSTLVAGFVAALILGVGAALLREFQIGGFSSREQVATALRSSEALSIPRVKSRNRISDLILEEPLGAFAEALRMLRLSVERALAARSGSEGRGGVICVTSTRPGEGKTTLALSLARTFAAGGTKTILVDLDLRRPAVAEASGLESSQALLNFLISKGDSSRLTKPGGASEGKSLNVIVGGGRPRAPTDGLLASRAFQEMIETLRRQYDVVILDTPPVLAVVDPLLVVRESDLVIMPIAHGETSQAQVRDAVNRIARHLPEGSGILPVLNMEKDPRGKTYDGYYVEN
jgi:polysaccharide biosynthesis transport protein